VTLTCSLDCSFSITLDSRRPVLGVATGRVPKALRFVVKLAPGRHIVAATATAAMNAGLPGLAGKTFVVR